MWAVNANPRPLYHWEKGPVRIVQEAGWATGPVRIVQEAGWATGPVRIVQEAGWATGPVRMGAENLAHTGIRSPKSPACT
jgi:hypothetical protein